jgi:beta-phosphoglucomutase-like phosphatase (HAD superfamily)
MRFVNRIEVFLMGVLPFAVGGPKPSAAMASIGSFTLPTTGFDAVIFDCDGTLVDSMPAHFEAWCEALALYGAGGIFKEDVFNAMGGRPTRDIVVEINDEYDLHLDPEAVAFAKREAFLKRLQTLTLIDEVAAFAQSLRGKIPMAVASGGSRMVVEKTLHVVRAAELLGVAPSRCLVLEDAPAGILAAQQAGMQVVAVPSPLVSSL